jgi:hypothetical protein
MDVSSLAAKAFPSSKLTEQGAPSAPSLIVATRREKINSATTGFIFISTLY